jgi:GTP-binding protein
MNEPVSQVDKSLVQLVVASHKPCLIGGNKLDMGQHSDPEDWGRYLRQQLKGLHFAPALFLSARDGIHVTETLSILWELGQQARTQISTAQLNEILHDAQDLQRPASRGRVPRLYYGTQIGSNPPTVLVFVNEPSMFRGQYDRFLQNALRKATPWKEIPIRLVYRARQQTDRAAHGSPRSGKTLE